VTFGVWRALLVAILACAFPATLSAQTPSPVGEGSMADTPPASIEVNTRPIAFFDSSDHSRVRFGSLEYRSGLILTSRFPGFGGLSGLRLDAKGERFISFSDKGTWFTGRILYQGKEMTGLSDVQAAPMLGPDGAPITTRGWFDSESIAVDGSHVYIGLERVNQILRFDITQGVAQARGEPILVPSAVRRLPFNLGLEAMVMVPKGLPLQGTLVALSERGLDPHGNLKAFMIGGSTPGEFSVRRTDKYDISDAALLSQGDLLVLERKFSWAAGIGIRIRRIPLSSIALGSTVDGPTIFEADLGQEIDNMEGIDVHQTPDGEIVLTLVSDDNFSPLQRTLLLQFTLVERNSEQGQ